MSGMSHLPLVPQAGPEEADGQAEVISILCLLPEKLGLALPVQLELLLLQALLDLPLVGIDGCAELLNITLPQPTEHVTAIALQTWTFPAWDGDSRADFST